MLSLLYEGEWKVTLAMRKQRARAAPRNATAIEIEIVIESPLWKQHRGAKALLRRAIAQAAAMVPPTAGELAIVLTDDAAIRTLNRDWRGKDFGDQRAVVSRPRPARRAGNTPPARRYRDRS